jgi:two-component system LytT family sensor kinase
MKKYWRPLWHILFWTVMVLFIILIALTNSKMSIAALMVVFVFYSIINIGLFYLNYLFLIPRFLDKKRYKLYGVAIASALITFGLIKLGVAMTFKQYVLIHMHKQISLPSYLLSTLFTSLIFIFLSIVLKFTVDWFINGRIQRDLENQRLTAELALLRSQINPHFLFNSLNSIYSLAYQKSDITPDAILKLSEIMRYMLYECNDNKVDLAKELQYLQNYIDLQKIRFGTTDYIRFDVIGTVCNQRIVPLLLISFIENAFKHGVVNNPDAPIEIKITIEDTQLDFYMHNKKHLHNRDAVGGIGLNNVKRRLNLLYPEKYKLAINDSADTYTCQLSLIL